MSRPGKPKTDDAEVLRRMMWYHSVISKTEMTHYELDIKLDIKYDEIDTKKVGKDKRRRKLFEELEKRHVMPFKKNLDEFLDHVENTKGLQNTAKIYRSFFWKVTKKDPLSVVELRSVIFEIFKTYSLFEVVGNVKQSKKIKHIQNSEYVSNLLFLLKKIDFSLDQLALIIALFRESYFVGNVSLANEIFLLYQIYVESITESDDIHISLKDEFFRICSSRLLNQYLEKLPDNWKSYDHMSGVDFKESFAGKFLSMHDHYCWI